MFEPSQAFCGLVFAAGLATACLVLRLVALLRPRPAPRTGAIVVDRKHAGSVLSLNEHLVDPDEFARLLEVVGSDGEALHRQFDATVAWNARYHRGHTVVLFEVPRRA